MTKVPRTLYIDTGLLSLACENIEFREKVPRLAKAENLILCFSEITSMEFSQATRKFDQLIDLICEVPTGLIMPGVSIRKKEAAQYPAVWQPEHIVTAIFQLELLRGNDPIALLKKMMHDMNEARPIHQSYLDKFKAKIIEGKVNFPKKNGKFVSSQDKEFGAIIIRNWLEKDYNVNIPIETKIDPNSGLFKAFWLHSLYIFYKYYLQNRDIALDSEWGDLFHLDFLPYCDYALMENDLQEIVEKQIRRRYPALFGNIRILKKRDL